MSSNLLNGLYYGCFILTGSYNWVGLLGNNNIMIKNLYYPNKDFGTITTKSCHLS